MNSKQYQKFTFDEIPAAQILSDGTKINGTKTYSFQIRNGYTFATGLFLYCVNSIVNLLVSIKIDGNEILPVGTDATIFRWTEGISRNEALWDFSKEAIKCEGKRVEITFENESTSDFDGEMLDLYLLLQNQVEEFVA